MLLFVIGQSANAGKSVIFVVLQNKVAHDTIMRQKGSQNIGRKAEISPVVGAHDHLARLTAIESQVMLRADADMKSNCPYGSHAKTVDFSLFWGICTESLNVALRSSLVLP